MSAIYQDFLENSAGLTTRVYTDKVCVTGIIGKYDDTWMWVEGERGSQMLRIDSIKAFEPVGGA